ncbi:DUF6074 family protein [Bradyrhizobium sp. LA6.10]|uniref:DUF6074 family protein n=1 Tax=Bradyrhizobium sp. LA6.10 TaxID=3156318 RepID=UPI003398E361
MSRAVRNARREVRPDASSNSEDAPRLRIRIAEPKAKVMLLPGRFRGAEYVKRHVKFVIRLEAERGEQHVQRNLDAIRRRLDEMGVGKRDADREVRSIEGAVRAELWRQVLLP